MTAPERPLSLATLHRRIPGTTSSRPGDPAASPAVVAAVVGVPAAIAWARRTLWSGIARQLVVFGLIGVVSTAAYALLYLAIRPFMGAVAANGQALLVTAIGNTAANRRLTFGVRDTSRAAVIRDQVAGVGALLLALAITSSAITLLSVAIPEAGRTLELAVLVAANAVATVARFVVLRVVITHDRPALAPVPVAANTETRP